MKKIIDGKLLNTETAKKIGESDWGEPGSFDYVCETLYRTKSGAFFIYGTGGADTRYAVPDGNFMAGGSKIVLLSSTAARKWAEENLTADEYLSVFDAEEVEPDFVCVSAQISKELKGRLDAYKDAKGKTATDIIITALDFYLPAFCDADEAAEIKKSAKKIYTALLEAGIVKEGQELTAQQIDYLDGLCAILSQK